MINIDNGMDYKEFKAMASEEHKKMISRLEEQSQPSRAGLDKVKKIDKERNIVVFTETRCEDSATTMPFLMKLADLNKNIKVSFFKREGNEDILEELTGKKRIPSILRIDDQGKIEKSYIEFPKKVNEMVCGLEGEERKAIAQRVRAGEFNKEIEEEIINILI